MKRSRILTALAVLTMLAALVGTGCGQDNSEPVSQAPQTEQTASPFAGGSGTADDPWQIAEAAQLRAVTEHLEGHYVLTANLDLSGEADFDSIGYFEPASSAPEDEETPKASSAFSGVFDGAGHTIANVTIAAKEQAGVGLFGCVSGDGAGVKNLTVENLTVLGGAYTGGIIGYGDYGVLVQELQMRGSNTVSGTSLVGGVIGAAHCNILDCQAEAEVTLRASGAQGAGVIVGGEEDGYVENCTASGSVTAAEGCFSIGGLAGCFHNSTYARNCSVTEMTIQTGENCYMVGGLTGHAGTAEGAPTAISGCTVRETQIEAAGGTERVGGIVGSGFYGSAYAAYYPEPTAFALSQCQAEATISGGRLVGAMAGYVYDNSTLTDCQGTVTDPSGQQWPMVGGDLTTAELTTLL